MIWQILYVLSFWVYFIGEGITEGLTWKCDRYKDSINSFKYHFWRVVENLGIVGIIFLLIFTKANLGIWIALLSASSGLCIYEFCFCSASYGNWKHKKTSKWFGVSHWSWQTGIIIILLSTAGLIFLIK